VRRENRRKTRKNIASIQKTTLEIKEGNGNNNTKNRGTVNTSFIVGRGWQHPFMDDIMEVPL